MWTRDFKNKTPTFVLEFWTREALVSIVYSGHLEPNSKHFAATLFRSFFPGFVTATK